MEESQSVHHALQILQVLIVLTGGGLVALWATWRLKVPDIAIYLLLGMFLGPAVLGAVRIPADSTLNQVLLTFGASALLFEGGMSIEFKVLRRVLVSVLSLATLGVLITAGITAVAAHFLLGIPWMHATLMAAVISSTDPATLVPVFRYVKIRPHVEQAVVTESAFNDATGAILTFTVLGLVLGSAQPTVGAILGGFAWQALAGGVLGAGLALGVAFAVSRFEWLKGYEPSLLPLLIAGSYLAATLGMRALHLPDASGFMAVFSCGLIFGNARSMGIDVPHEDLREMHSFLGHSALLMRMFIFLLLGSQVDFRILGAFWLPALMVVLVFMLLARPATVMASCAPDRRAQWEPKELLFMFWTRETGVIPAALAGFISAALKAKADPALQQLGPMIASVTFMAILMTILVQATTTPWVARRLGLLVGPDKA